MRKLAAWCHDRRRTVISLWVAAFVVCIGVWAAAPGEFVNNFNLPGTESQRTYDLLQERFPQQSGDTANVIFAVKDGAVLDAANRPTIERAVAEIKKSPEVLAVADPFAEGAPVSKDGKITFAQIQFRAAPGDVDPAPVKTMAENVLKLDGQTASRSRSAATSSTGRAAEPAAPASSSASPSRRSSCSSCSARSRDGLPLIVAFAMIVSRDGARRRRPRDRRRRLRAAARGDDRLGVGIDYALLILNRFRGERAARRDVREATLIALDTAGPLGAVRGHDVVIAMLGMMLLGISFLYGPAIAAGARRAATMLAALTLLPALLSSCGGRVKPASPDADAETRLGALEQRRRASSAPVRDRRARCCWPWSPRRCSACAWPRRRRQRRDGRHHAQSPTTCSPRASAPGFNGPLLVVVELPQAGRHRRVARSSRGAERAGRASPRSCRRSSTRRGDTATMIVFPTTTPQDEATRPARRACATTSCRRSSEATGAAASHRRRHRDDRRLSERPGPSCRCSSASSSASRCCCWRSSSARSLIPVKAGVMNLLSIGGGARRHHVRLPGRPPRVADRRRRHRPDRVRSSRS